MRIPGILGALAAGLMAAHTLAAAEPPRLSYVALNVLDEKRSLDFYESALGMSERRRITPNASFKEILLGFGPNPDDAGVLLVVRSGRTQPYQLGDGYSRFILHVPDLDAVAKHLADLGLKLEQPIREVKELKLRYTMLKDPDGYLIELLQTTP